ncbi:glycine cleavage system protein GcvH [Nibricoccus sp. IMCC34717]|uniref:glycine cleavage system protein GcvH n=1 Tax=Nibricoccus sp. IMCC34717 TaxID=3034021 RepID=UPI00385164D4
MSQVPSELKYTKSHEWVRAEVDGTVTIGITDYAQSSLGDITFVQTPKVGATLVAGEVFGVVESVKAASDLYAPIAGAVVAVNKSLDSTPEVVNQAPYTDGWMMKLKPTDAASLQALMDAAAYGKSIG